jgi:hypothetical protein
MIGGCCRYQSGTGTDLHEPNVTEEAAGAASGYTVVFKTRFFTTFPGTGVNFRRKQWLIEHFLLREKSCHSSLFKR